MSIQSIGNASMSMQAMSAAPARDAQAARNQTESAAGVETRAENVQQNANAQEQAQRVPMTVHDDAVHLHQVAVSMPVEMYACVHAAGQHDLDHTTVVEYDRSIAH